MFTRLPGFTVTAAGLERHILRALPRWWLLGSLLLALPSLGIRLIYIPLAIADSWLTTVDIYFISLIILHWTVLLTVGIAAFIVMVMKGPAYVADAYPLIDADSPANSPANSA